jgi:hypothetical protein
MKRQRQRKRKRQRKVSSAVNQPLKISYNKAGSNDSALLP